MKVTARFRFFLPLALMIMAASCGKPFFKPAAERNGVGADVVMVSPDEAMRYDNIYEYIKTKFPMLIIGKDGADSYTIRIRGVNSITGPNDPVMYVDGFRVVDLNGVNPADVEKIEIVKGPRAAFYGEGSTNGVISITTRHAR